MKKFFLIFLLTLGLFGAVGAKAAEVYVDGDNGDDITGSGTDSAPYQTVTKALTVIAGGDTVYCRGTIIDAFSVPAAAAGTADNYTTITSQPGYEATINANGSGVAISSTAGANYIRIEDLTIANALQAAIYIGIGGGVDYWDISNNNITQSGVAAFAILVTQSDYVSITGNDIDGQGDLGFGMYFGAVDHLDITGNKFHDIQYLVIASEGLATNLTIFNNWFYDNGGGDSAMTSVLALVNSYDIKVINNSFYNNYDADHPVHAIILWATTPEELYDVEIKNNIFNHNNYSFYFNNQVTYGISIDYNDFYENDQIGGVNGGDDYQTLAEWQDTLGYDLNSITGDPLFTADNDLHLQDASSCVDRGQNIGLLESDYDGEARTYNVTDIGADERPVLSTAPDFLQATPLAKKADLSWEQDSKYPATSYELVLNEGAPLEYLNNQATVSGLTYAQSYDYKVKAVYETSYDTYYSDYSDLAQFTTLPKKVKNINTSAAPYIKWKKQKRVSGYIIKLMNSNGKKIRLIFVGENRANDTIDNLVVGKKYKIKVRAQKKVGNSYILGKWSKVKKFVL